MRYCSLRGFFLRMLIATIESPMLKLNLLYSGFSQGALTPYNYLYAHESKTGRYSAKMIT